jgi:hypothetical protein
MRDIRGEDHWVGAPHGERPAHLVLSGEISGAHETIRTFLESRFRRVRLSSDAVSFVVNDSLGLCLSVRPSGTFAFVMFLEVTFARASDPATIGRSYMDQVFNEIEVVTGLLNGLLEGVELRGKKLAAQQPIPEVN